MALHLTTVELVKDRRMFKPVCSCGWAGLLRTAIGNAITAGDTHKDIASGKRTPFGMELGA